MDGFVLAFCYAGILISGVRIPIGLIVPRLMLPGQLAQTEQSRKDAERVEATAAHEVMGQVAKLNQAIAAAKRYRGIRWSRIFGKAWKRCRCHKPGKASPGWPAFRGLTGPGCFSVVVIFAGHSHLAAARHLGRWEGTMRIHRTWVPLAATGLFLFGCSLTRRHSPAVVNVYPHHLRGRAMAISPERKLAITDVGKNQGLKQKMRGVVYRGGQSIGRLEIAEIMPEFSTTEIVGSGPGVQQGDQVVFWPP